MRTIADACEAQNEIERRREAVKYFTQLAAIKAIVDKFKRGKLSPREAIKGIEAVLK